MTRMLLAILGLAWWMGAGSPAAAMPPAIRFPDWYKTSALVTAWNPATRELRVTVRVEAPIGPIADLAVEVVWPAGFTGRTPRRTLDRLPAGQSWAAEFVAEAPASFDGWFEVVATGRPDRQALQAHIEQPGAYAASAKAVLLAELANLAKPLPIGFCSPLSIEAQLAATVPRAFLPLPLWPVAGRRLHLWAPAVAFTDPAVQQRFAEWQAAVLAQQATPSRQAGTALLAALGGTEPYEVKPAAEQPPIALHPEMARQLVQMSIEALQSLESPPPVLAKQVEALRAAPPSFTDGFRAANLGVLLAAQGATTVASTAWQLALERWPAWNLVREWQDSLGRK
ncbi:MAG: hypothetical protein OZSIB_3358 [Candidatus Ozemobacter sibiricus]|uniref:Uncharacterized protein n=1 Tax=Candidatus Ozemobacter sibiricus TaxID=2268124 RepID=A0A367ZF91_9BACT|nr:MAG: hypothetical protein OZSIB_3358 [Candidatus Ozemobacter sibiricus]